MDAFVKMSFKATDSLGDVCAVGSNLKAAYAFVARPRPAPGVLSGSSRVNDTESTWPSSAVASSALPVGAGCRTTTAGRAAVGPLVDQAGETEGNRRTSKQVHPEADEGNAAFAVWSGMMRLCSPNRV